VIIVEYKPSIWFVLLHLNSIYVQNQVKGCDWPAVAEAEDQVMSAVMTKFLPEKQTMEHGNQRITGLSTL
jgi:hypothetical protein